jgi:hypothetical protein|tara:strand:+ start:1895 stop:3850 length:1956 start_codon:yes stop_codon:yes gene_type:complete
MLLPTASNAEEPSKDLEIEWENSGEITFLVPSEQWIQFSIGINSTSSNSQSIAIEIIGETNWGINQSKFIIEDTEISNQDSFELDSNEFTNITVKIYIPEIENGLPQANIEYPFQLKLSNSTESYEIWNYAISILPKYSLTIDEIIEEDTIEPLGNKIHEIKIRNSGNIQTSFVTEISPIGDDGNIIFKNESNRFEEAGWDATLSGWIEASSLEPNESATLKITFNSPYTPEGNLSISLQINSTLGGIKENIILNTSISTIKSSKIDIEDTNCNELILNKNCKLNLKITNTGNYREYIQNTNCTTNSDYIIFNNSQEDELNQITFSDVTYNTELLEPLEFKLIEFEISLNSEIKMINAGTIISINCNYYNNELEIIDSENLNLIIGTYLEIQIINVTSWVEDESLYLSIILENSGNLPESFSIGVSVSHEVPHGLIPVEDSIYDENSSRIRGFDLSEILPEENINITGWMNFPESNIENEPFWISIEVTTYSDSFENNWQENWWIEGTGSEKISNNPNNQNSNFISLLNKFNEYGFSILSGFIAIIMIFQALRIRSNKKTQEERTNENKNEDWMSTFHEKKDEIIDISSPTTSKNDFEKMFSEKGGNKVFNEIDIPNKDILNDANDKINLKNEHNSIQSYDNNSDDSEYDF